MGFYPECWWRIWCHRLLNLESHVHHTSKSQEDFAQNKSFPIPLRTHNTYLLEVPCITVFGFPRTQNCCIFRYLHMILVRCWYNHMNNNLCNHFEHSHLQPLCYLYLQIDFLPCLLLWYVFFVGMIFRRIDLVQVFWNKKGILFIIS